MKFTCHDLLPVYYNSPASQGSTQDMLGYYNKQNLCRGDMKIPLTSSRDYFCFVFYYKDHLHYICISEMYGNSHSGD